MYLERKTCVSWCPVCNVQRALVYYTEDKSFFCNECHFSFQKVDKNNILSLSDLKNIYALIYGFE